MTCEYCEAGHKRFKLRGGRQYVHHVKYRVIVCQSSSEVERRSEEPRVGGSIPPFGTNKGT